jgi:Methyltransferase domain
MIDSTFTGARERGLVWLPEVGMGYYPVEESPYDSEYFDRYADMGSTDLGEALNRERVRLVDSVVGLREVVDIGIGSGAFIEARGEATFGFDVNPKGVVWLSERRLYRDPRRGEVESATFWDSLEHIHNPGPILTNIQRFAFVSLPLFRDARHVMESKHFRKDEHCWYWTREGLLWWMGEHGFTCVSHSTAESLLGREDVHTFVFERKWKRLRRRHVRATLVDDTEPTGEFEAPC